MKEIRHPLAISIMQEFISRVPVYCTGTYNRADPTHFEKGEIEVDGLIITTNDCTWGIEVTIKTKVRRIELAAIYYSRESYYSNGHYYPALIPRKTWSNKWFLIIKKLIPLMEKINRYEEEQEYFYDDYRMEV